MDRKEFLIKTWRSSIKPLSVVIAVCFILILVWKVCNNDRLFRTADKVSNIFAGIGLLIVENWLLFVCAITAFFLFWFLRRIIPRKYHASIGNILRLAAYIVLMVCALSGSYSIIRRGDYEKLIAPVIGVGLVIVFDYFGRRRNIEQKDGASR